MPDALVERFGKIGLALAASVVVFLANGGYVYKTTCPLPAGGSQSSWTWAIDDVIPYTRQTAAPCVSHSGARLLLSALGISPLHDR